MNELQHERNKARRRERYKENRAAELAKAREYYLANREELLAKQRAYYREHREQKREYYLQCKRYGLKREREERPETDPRKVFMARLKAHADEAARLRKERMERGDSR